MNNTIPAVDKTVRFLLALSERPHTQAELSEKLGTAMSTAYRILTTLQAHDWVRKEGAVYSLSGGLVPLIGSCDSEMELLERAKKQADMISERYGIACKLSIRQGNQQKTFHRVEPPGPVALTGIVGSLFPIFEGSVGAALLADESEEVIRELIETSPVKLPETADPELVFDRIREIRARGTVLNSSKNRWGIVAMSIPLRDRRGRVSAALTLIGARPDFAGKRRTGWDTVLKKAAHEIEE